MQGKRRYQVKKTNDFIVLSFIFFFLCLWAVKDAWFPSPKVLKKHPIEIEVSFETDGSIEKIMAAEDELVHKDQVIALLHRDKMIMKLNLAKSAYTEAKKKQAMMEQAAKHTEKNEASENETEKNVEGPASSRLSMEKALARVMELQTAIDAAELRSPNKGRIKKLKKDSHSPVKAGETVIVINPQDHFYTFNKSLAIVSFFAFWIFLFMHIFAS